MQKILIVDDRKQNLFTLEQVLANFKVEFVRATSGNDALKATLYNDFALAILDVQMPEMDGYELAELLRSDPKTKDLPVIFLSAVYHDDYHIFKGYESGAVDFITKPYEPKILLSKVNFFFTAAQAKECITCGNRAGKNQKLSGKYSFFHGGYTPCRQPRCHH